MLESHVGRILVYDRKDLSSEVQAAGFHWCSSLEQLRSDTLILAVPIRTIPELLQVLRPRLQPGQLVMDVASVKTRIRDWMLDLLPEQVEILNTHPMFGPDSLPSDPVRNLVFCPTRISAGRANEWRHIFTSMGCTLRDMQPEEHDRLAARSQGLTHFLGRTLQEMGILRTEIDTLGFRQVHAVVEQTCEDSEELFEDLQQYNPFTPEMIRDLTAAATTIASRIPSSSDTINVGYQGIPGSFSHAAAELFRNSQGFQEAILQPLISSQGVLDGLGTRRVEYGIIAMENARGGVVMESIHALAGTHCQVVTMFRMQVTQCLLARKGEHLDTISSIRSHPQALRQCSGYLQTHFPGITLSRAEDTALAAKALAEGKYETGTAVIAPGQAAKLYGLEVLEPGIQDLEDNPTLFLVLGRPGQNRLQSPLRDSEVGTLAK